jgi:ribonuclease VapC
MVIDTSAIIAVLLNEANAVSIAQAIETGSPRLLSAANFLEASIVIESRKGEAGGGELDLMLYRAAIEVVAVDQDQVEIARLAWRRFGKGRHPAGLNYGECFAMLSQNPVGYRCCFRATISRKPISPACRCKHPQKPERANRNDNAAARNSWNCYSSRAP